MSDSSDSSLFRAKAREAFAHKTAGEPVMKMPVTWWWLASIVLILFIFLIIYVVTNDYARKEKAVGALSYTRGESLLMATLSGAITNIDIREQSEVTKGDVLFQILADRTNTSGLSTSQEYNFEMHK